MKHDFKYMIGLSKIDFERSSLISYLRAWQLLMRGLKLRDSWNEYTFNHEEHAWINKFTLDRF